MIVLGLAGVMLGSIALILAGSRGRPEARPVRVEARDRKHRKRR
jgi:hypothetical protein